MRNELKRHPADPGRASRQEAPAEACFLILPGVELLDVGGPAQVLEAAGAYGPGYALSFVGPDPTVTTAQGLRLSVDAGLPDPRPFDLVVVPGVRHMSRVDSGLDPDVAGWLVAAHEGGARIASVCAGAFLLGSAGLLNGRRCTTHWSLTSRLASRWPSALVEERALFVQDGLVTTSAGIASGIDMALWLVEQDHGPIVTARVARELVLYLRRDGEHAQTSIYLDHRTHLDPAVHRAQDWLLSHFTEQVPLAALADVAGTSARHLVRGFTAATGMTPLRYQQRLRLELAESLLRDPRLTLDAVAARCGFSDSRSLRRLWRQHHGSPPSANRNEREGQRPS